MMKKNEQVEEYIEAVPVLQHAKAALLVCALAVKSVVSQIAAARLAPTSQGMLKLE
ncbi:unnamed protein product [Prunus armeniaca]|uniref:Uncharacterized protein n=1 Tax=Prunus armeniaca TaxID=36596 RepID=A0A6J5X0U4_PRUAR|nr:unnamed protein product [Prunus armeniaca]CAB4304854.1 unnamed protein product [Prunus armeniaca]